MKKFMIGVIIFFVLLAGLLVYMATDSNHANGKATDTTVESGSVESANNHTIIMNEKGFSPKTITISKGDTVIFTNTGKKNIWPASAMHPTHTVYPGSDIKKCGTDAEKEIFDACEGIAPSKSWSFTFNNVGKWSYHDHLQASSFGSIIVQ